MKNNSQQNTLEVNVFSKKNGKSSVHVKLSSDSQWNSSFKNLSGYG